MKKFLLRLLVLVIMTSVIFFVGMLFEDRVCSDQTINPISEAICSAKGLL